MLRFLISRQAESLQTKFLADILIKIFQCKAGAWEGTLEATKLFMPLEFAAEDACLNSKAAAILQMVHSLVHQVNLEFYLSQPAALLTPDYLEGELRPLLRLSNLASFKKLMTACHTSLAQAKFDKECEVRAADLSKKLPQLERDMLADFNQVKLKPLELLERLNAIISLNNDCASLPQKGPSVHAPLRDQVQKLCHDALGSNYFQLALRPVARFETFLCFFEVCIPSRHTLDICPNQAS